MPKTYGYNAQPQAPGNTFMFGEIPENGRLASGIAIGTSPFNCCGLSTIAGFHGITRLTEFAERAAWLAALWKTTHGRTHFVYVINPIQDMGVSCEHGALLACGAKLICKFPNLQPGHSGYDLKMYMVNLNDGIGRFFDANGTAYVEPPKAEPTKKKGATINVVDDVAPPVAAPVAHKRTLKTKESV